MHASLLFADVSLPGRPGRWQVAVSGQHFCHIGETYSGSAERRIEAAGALLVPGLIELHTHVDKTYTWQAPSADDGAREHEALREAIRQMHLRKRERTLAGVVTAARRAFDRAIRHGTCLLHSHIDIGDSSDLAVVETLVSLREAYSGRLQIRYTALGSCDTPIQQALMRKALALGVDCVGGAPALGEDPQRGVAAAFELACELRKPLDLHIDENENPHSPCLEALADLVIAHGFALPVLASHCCSLAYAAPADRARVLAKVKAAGISLISLPACNLVLMGRHVPAHKPRGALPVVEAQALGINVCVGTDNVGDPFQPWGDYDPLQSAALCAHVAQLDQPEEAFALVTNNAARALRHTTHGIAVGQRADCSLLAATNLRDALAERPLRTHVLHGGRVVLEQQLSQTWS